MASDKNPAPAPAYNQGHGSILPVPQPLSWYFPDGKTSDMEPDTASDPAFHSFSYNDGKIPHRLPPSVFQGRKVRHPIHVPVPLSTGRSHDTGTVPP